MKIARAALVIICSALACAGCAMPGDTVRPKNTMVFDAAYANFMAQLSWSAYAAPDFKAYRLVKSRTDRNPSCAAGHVVMSGDDSAVTGFSETGLETGEYYYRLCLDKTDGTTLQSEVERIFVKSGPFEQGVPGPGGF